VKPTQRLLLWGAGECRDAAEAEHIAKHGKFPGETLFIELVAHGED